MAYKLDVELHLLNISSMTTLPSDTPSSMTPSPFDTPSMAGLQVLVFTSTTARDDEVLLSAHIIILSRHVGNIQNKPTHVLQLP